MQVAPLPEATDASATPRSRKGMATQLAALPAIERLSPACIRILGGNPGKFTLQGTNTYLLGTGRHRILIDTGEGKPAWAESVKSALEEEKASIETVLVSHWHHDHTGGLADILSICPEAQVYKNEPEDGQRNIADGQTFGVSGASLTAVHSPGHTTDHVTFVFHEEDAMFTADNVLGHGTAVFENLGVYVDSLERMRHMFKGRVYPGHGPVVSEGPAKIIEYIRHRQERENQVLRMLRTSHERAGVGSQSDDWTVMELVKVIYKDVPEALHVPASGGVLQILRKLEAEGQVAQTPDAERWITNDKSSL
ncbi:conserved hypothetical protein [Verticillium alfalfae VaMs.102]|uniref:Metallo-beta-lactamase domain-containing protein n=1 Tax=Verticillium alfalfae (strain VaMs.102 / ATCC MYA-4576 / FGSC 10136) TaxID=526221 RepID=C9SRB6_VERA1|nr:conserved hypothetical protein [Verticillium alfalfae VaMs.102]EEY21331.1 conserved hypothetical protein [Verticillium alfalfae VaMs.102]